jgi:hypothetical protein
MRFFVIATLAIYSVLFIPIAYATDGCETENAECNLPTGGRGMCVRGEIGDLVCGLGTTISGNSAGSPSGTVGNTVNNTSNTGTNVSLINPLKGGGTLESFLSAILAFIVRIGTVIVILMTVYVGYMFVAAKGAPAKIEEARKALLWTVVGALILLGAQVIASGIIATVDALSAGR